MRTVDPLGRHEECETIVDAVRRGNHVLVLGHPALGSDPVRRRIRRSLAEHTTPVDLDAAGHGLAGLRRLGAGTTIVALRTDHGVRVVLHVDVSADVDREIDIPDEIAHEPVTIVRLGRLGRRRIDRLIDDRLARRGMEPSWLGRTDRSLVHALSAGYPPLAAAIIDDRLSPSQAPRTAGAAAQVLRALPPHARRAATMLATLPGIERRRIEPHLGSDALSLLIDLGIASADVDGVRLGRLFSERLATTDAPPLRETAHVIDEIVQSWRRPTSTTASELVLAARALERGIVTAPKDVHAAITAIAAASVYSRSTGDTAARYATIVQRLDPGLMPHLMRALATGEGSPIDALLIDTADRGHDMFVSRLGDQLMRSMVLVPDGAPMSPEGIDRLVVGSGLRTLASELLELDRARVALDEGRYDVVLDASRAAAGSEDALVSMRAIGMLAVSAGALGSLPTLMEAVSELRSIMSAMPRWTPVAIAVAARTIAQVRSTVASVGMPTMTVLDEALDQLIRRAAISGDGTSIGYASLAELASRASHEQAQVARRTLERLAPPVIKARAMALVEVYEQASTTSIEPQLLRDHAWATSLSVGITVLAAIEDTAPETLLERVDEHLAAGVLPNATVRLVQAHLRTLLGRSPGDLSDLRPGELTPLLRAMLWHAQGVSAGDARLVADAAGLVVAAKHRRLAEAILADAARLGADRTTIARLRNRLTASVTASTKRLRANRQWIDRDAAGLAAAGLTDLQISDLVGVPLGTVRSRSRTIMADLGLPAREQLREPLAASERP